MYFFLCVIREHSEITHTFIQFSHLQLQHPGKMPQLNHTIKSPFKYLD